MSGEYIFKALGLGYPLRRLLSRRLELLQKLALRLFRWMSCSSRDLMGTRLVAQNCTEGASEVCRMIARKGDGTSLSVQKPYDSIHATSVSSAIISFEITLGRNCFS